MPAPGVGALRFLYVGVDDTSAAVAFYCDQLGAVERWRFQRFGADVAGVELGDHTLVLLADHRPTGTILPIWVTDDLAATAARCRAAGLEVAGPEGTPEGDVIVVAGADHQVAFLEVVRPDALDGAYRDPANTHRVLGSDDTP
jgi:catechol 2,3-dioxygenase-like lactoylglutathione lyase family enzyme